LLDETKLFAVCYAETDGSGTDTTWADSGIRVKLTKLQSLNAHAITHSTRGHLAALPDLSTTYVGSLANNKWISIVPSSKLGGYPCSGAVTAGHIKTAQYSGPLQAGGSNKIVSIDTSALSKTVLFAVCYTEVASPDLTTQWSDSGIRLTISKVSATKYNIATGQTARLSDASNLARATFPQVANKKLTYVGELANNKWISLVLASLGGSIHPSQSSSNEPCVHGSEAAADSSSSHSAPARAGAGDKEVTILQSANLLTASSTFAVCYA
jgi:hypothetical protein